MDDHEFTAVRRRVVRRLILRLTFVFNLIFFLLIMLQLVLDIGKTPGNIIGAAFFALIWGSFVLAHGALAFNLFGRFVDRATHRELEQQQIEEKPKRSHLELGEDGELNEVEDEWPLDEKEKRQIYP